MKLFKKKYWYTIITDDEYIFAVQRFAEAHKTRKSIIQVYAVNSSLIYVNFKTDEDLVDIQSLLSKEFNGVRSIQIKDHLTFIS